MIGALVLSAFVGTALAVLFSPRWANTGLAVFYLLWFIFPWRILTRDSIQDQQAESRPSLYAGREFPLRMRERAAPMMILITGILALMFGGAGITMMAFGVLEASGQNLKLGPVIAICISILLLLIFAFLVVLTFTLAGSRKQVIIDRDRIHIYERTWDVESKAGWREKLSSSFRARATDVPLREYRELVESVERHTSSDGPDYDEYTLILKHSTDSEKDVVIYRAVHSRYLTLLKRHYSQRLQVPISETVGL
jgi:hypothetical protein